MDTEREEKDSEAAPADEPLPKDREATGSDPGGSENEDDIVEEASKESFPASDPPAW